MVRWYMLIAFCFMASWDPSAFCDFWDHMLDIFGISWVIIQSVSLSISFSLIMIA